MRSIATVRDNASEFAAYILTFAHYFKSLGYSTCLSEKMHFVAPDRMYGFESRVTTDIYPADFAWTPNWQQADGWIDKWYHNMQTVKENRQTMASFQIDYDEEVEFAAKRKLFDYARDGPCLGAWWPLSFIPTTLMWRGTSGGIFIAMKKLICRSIPITQPMPVVSGYWRELRSTLNL